MWWPEWALAWSLMTTLPLEPAPPPINYVVTLADTRLTPGSPWVVEMDVHLRSLQPGWVDLPLLSTSALIEFARLGDGEAPIYHGVDGYHHLVTRLEGEESLHLRATLVSPPDASQLPSLALVSAPIRRVSSSFSQPHLHLEGGLIHGSDWYLPASLTVLEGRVEEEGVAPPRAPQLEVFSQVALRVEDTYLEGWAELAGTVSDQRLEQIHLDPGPGVEILSVMGPEVARWRQDNGLVVIDWAAPVDDSFVLSLEWRSPLPGSASQKVPIPRVVEASQGQGWLSLRPDGGAWLIPREVTEVEATATRLLPEGLRPGDMGLGYRLTGPDPTLELALLRSTPLEMPAAVVSEASFRVQHNEEGRQILKARYQVRNDRLPHLRLALPPGWALMSARVGGRVVSVAQVEEGVLLIPLERSVEGLSGLIAYPVDIDLTANTGDWGQRGGKTLTVPAINIPIARAEWDMWLPPDFEVQVEGGTAQVVEAPAQAADPFAPLVPRRQGEKPAPTPPPAPAMEQQDTSVALFNEAWRLYQTNSWDEAATYVEEALKNDPTNTSAKELQGNLELLTDDQGGEGGESSQSRRVRDLARARSIDQSIEQAKAVERADYALKTGELEAARKELEQVVELSGQLAGLEQVESKDSKSLRRESEVALEKTRDALSLNQKQETTAASSPSSYFEDVGRVAGNKVSRASNSPPPGGSGQARPMASPESHVVVPVEEDRRLQPEEAPAEDDEVQEVLQEESDTVARKPTMGRVLSGDFLRVGSEVDKVQGGLPPSPVQSAPQAPPPPPPPSPPRNRTVRATSVELVLPYVGPHIHVEQQLIHSGELISVEVSYHRRRSK